MTLSWSRGMDTMAGWQDCRITGLGIGRKSSLATSCNPAVLQSCHLEGRKFRGPGTVPHGASNRHILQLVAVGGAPQQQAAAAHVAAADEIDRERQPVAEDL